MTWNKKEQFEKHLEEILNDNEFMQAHINEDLKGSTVGKIKELINGIYDNALKKYKIENKIHGIGRDMNNEEE